MEQEVVAALGRIPRFAGKSLGAASAERLAGLTNRNYKVTVDGESYVLRLAGAGTEDYIDREVEEHNARIAASVGVNAEVLFFDQGDATMLCRYIEGSTTMDSDRFRDLGAVARAARALKRVHEGPAFRFRFDVFAMMDDYLALLKRRDAPIPDGYGEVQQEAEAVRRVLTDNPPPLASCHNDPLAENFLDTAQRMYLVDWEYSGLNDPMWDLGDVSVEADFGPEQDQAFVEAYFGAVPAAAFGRMIMYKAMCDLLWTLWGVIQHVDENPTDDYWAYAVNRLERCQRLMGSDGFGAHLEAARGG